MERLQEASAEIAEELADAVMEAVPDRYRETVNSDCRAFYRTLVPMTLECIAQGTMPEEDELHLIRQSARRKLSQGIPVSVSLTSHRAAMAQFTSIVARYGSMQDVSDILVVMGRAATLSQLFMTFFVSESETEPRGHPEWWSEQPWVAKESLRLLARGYSTSEIARELNYSEQNITYHLGKLMKQFGCSNRTEMVGRAYEVGVIGESTDAVRGGSLRVA